jgi:hypothetical protein
MFAQHDTSDVFTQLLFLDFKLINNSKRNIENLSILNVSFHVLHNKHAKFSLYLSNRSAIDHNQ